MHYLLEYLSALLVVLELIETGTSRRKQNYVSRRRNRVSHYMEAALLAPKSEVSIFPWKQPAERIPLAVRQIRSFLRSHRPTTASASR